MSALSLKVAFPPSGLLLSEVGPSPCHLLPNPRVPLPRASVVALLAPPAACVSRLAHVAVLPPRKTPARPLTRARVPSPNPPPASPDSGYKKHPASLFHFPIFWLPASPLSHASPSAPLTGDPPAALSPLATRSCRLPPPRIAHRPRSPHNKPPARFPPADSPCASALARHPVASC